MSTNNKLTEGTKHDTSKPRFDLLSSHALSQLALVLTHGAEKYEAHNWRKGIAMSRLIAASYRHLNSINTGDDADPEFGLLHASHLMCCAMFMVEQTLMRPEFDDRWRPQGEKNSTSTSTVEMMQRIGEALPAKSNDYTAEEPKTVDWREHLKRMDGEVEG